MKYILLPIFLIIFSPTFSQKSDTLLDLKKKINLLKDIQDFIDVKGEQYYKSATSFDFDYDSLKRVRSQNLLAVLRDKRSLYPKIQIELEKAIGRPVISDDGKIKIYKFPELAPMATGHYFENFIQYTTSAGITNSYLLKSSDCGYTDGFNSIYKINGSDLYLATTYTVWCTTCNNEKAVVFRLNSKYLITDYPAFFNNKSCLSINSRSSEYDETISPVRSVDAVIYDAKKQEITIQYYKIYPINEEQSARKTDDLATGNPFYDYPSDKNGLVKVLLRFNGKRFVPPK